jgi:phosphohistidine phosphatase
VILYFLRHGQAEPAGHGDDAARRLTVEGETVLKAAATLWRRLNLRPDVVLTSPLARARRTAEIVCEELRLPSGPTADDRLRPGAGWSDLAQAMAGHGDARRVMFVGHEPDLSAAAAHLTGAASIRLRTGGMACLEFYGIPEPGGGELAWLLDPDLYGDTEGD